MFLVFKRFSKRESRTHPFAFDLIVRLFAGWPRKRLEKEKAKEVRVLTSAGNQKKKESLCCVSSDLAFCALPLLSECMLLLLVIIKPLL